MIAPTEGAVIAGKYVLEGPLARGGMGAVWRARHLELDVAVAVKLMDQTLVSSAEARVRFEREAKAAAQLDTKHVVHVRDYGVDGGMPYLVMELLKGEDLAARLARERRLSPVVAAGLLTQVARGLRKAHEASLVHRDLKPANIFLAVKDDEEVVKILDFGIAKATGTGLAGQATQSGAVIGSVHYMSPEQVRRSKSVDHRSDLWSLGVILFRVLTGRLPFPGEEIGDVLVRVCTEPVPVPSEIVPELSPGIDAFFMRALARGLEERFQSATEMADAFAVVAAAAPAPAPRMTESREPERAAGESPVEGQRASFEPTQEARTREWQTEKDTELLPASEPAAGASTLNPSLQTVRRGGGEPQRRAVVGIVVAGAIMLAVGATALGLRASSRPSAPATAGAPSAPPVPMATMTAQLPAQPEPEAPGPSAVAPMEPAGSAAAKPSALPGKLRPLPPSSRPSASKPVPAPSAAVTAAPQIPMP